MPRPKSKQELLDLSEINFNKLKSLIEGYTEEQQKSEFHPGTMNRNICDVIAHLHQWHLMMKDWYNVGMSGAKPDIPAKGYTWKTTPELNRLIWEKYRGEDLCKMLALFSESYTIVRGIIEKHTDEELFEKKRYKWTGTTSLGAYLISATSSHYDWAIKLIKKGLK